MTKGLFTDAERDTLIIESMVSNHVTEGIMVHLLAHLARKADDPADFLRQLSEELNGAADRIVMPPHAEVGTRFIESLRSKTDQLMAAALKRVTGSN